MTIPLPLIKPNQTARLLSHAYTTLETTLPGPADQPPCLVLVLPPAWNNRYQSLLYSDAGPHRYAVMGITKAADLAHVSWPGPIVVHIHWFSWVFNDCINEIEAAERFAALRTHLLAFRERTGARFLWTAHNIFPHGNRFPATFMKLRQWVFETFDCIHVMQDGHVAVLEEAFARKAQASFTVPHMTYDGSHPDCIAPSAAKVHYGITPETFVFGYFGSIHPYKNLETMLSAFDLIAADSARPVAALIGGVPSDSGTVQRLQQGWGDNPRVRLVMNTIPDHEIQYIHRASDVMVLPYGETLNSGAAFMAASFGQPFIMPRGMSSDALEGLGVSQFNPSEAGALEATMRAVMDGARGAVDEQARARSSSVAVSHAFFEALDRMIGRASGPRSANAQAEPALADP